MNIENPLEWSQVSRQDVDAFRQFFCEIRSYTVPEFVTLDKASKTLMFSGESLMKDGSRIVMIGHVPIQSPDLCFNTNSAKWHDMYLIRWSYLKKAEAQTVVTDVTMESSM
jgi:hypothetical protein